MPTAGGVLQTANYRGAFSTDLWCAGWTALSEYGILTPAPGLPVAYVPQHYGLFPHLRMADQLLFAPDAEPAAAACSQKRATFSPWSAPVGNAARSAGTSRAKKTRRGVFEPVYLGAPGRGGAGG